MSRIHRPSQPKPLAKKPTAKSAAAPKHQPTKKVAQDIERLKKAKNAEVSKGEDGAWVARSRTTQRKDTTTTTTLKETTGKVLDSSFEYSKSTSKPGLERETTWTSKTDMVGRRSSEARTTESRESDTRSDSRTSTKATDHWGIEKRTLEKSADVTLENGTEHAESRTARDSRGNRITSSDVTRVLEDGKSTVTTNNKREQGSELTTASSTTFEDGVFRLSDSADWKKTNSWDKSFLKETEFDASKVQAKADKVGNAVEKVLEWLGLEPAEWKSEVPAEKMHEHTFAQGDNSWVGARYGISGGQSVSFDGRGVDATFNRQAVAGVYANASGRTEGRYGEASYDAAAKAEAYASVDARGRLDSNGLTGQVDLRAGATIEATIEAQARTKSVTVLGTELDAGVEGKARAVAEAVAEATGTVAITRNPPTAIAKGTVGASAVAKVEGELRLSAGPFTVVGNAYASAGAEARATGIIGYEDGKLKLGGSAGAALGVGAGAGVTVEVDVRQIGNMAKNAADLNKDGKLDWKDAFQAVSRTAKFAVPGLGLFLRG